MDRYNITKQLGDGTYGSVLLATTMTSGEKVAIKKMKKKYYRWEDCLNLREVKSLRKLKHSNIIQLKEVVRENDQLYMVFEHMKENLYQMMKSRDKIFPESAVRNIVYQVLQGLAYMHKHGYFHRDLKPENLLCNGPELVKIADFGLAREIRSRPPYTDYVSTRWYRAPEILLRATNYNSPIDLWATGCIMAELYTLRPIFPGNSEIDEIFKISSILGTPSKADWPEGHQLSTAMNFKWPQCVPTNLRAIIPNAGNEGLQMMRDMMSWDPKKRPASTQSLRYPFFQVGQNLIASTNPQSVNKQQALGIEQQQKQQQQQQHRLNRTNDVQPPIPHHKMVPFDMETDRFESQPPVKALPHLASKQTGVNKPPNKSGRKRWGASETWDDWDDFDLGTSINRSKKQSSSKKEEEDIFGFNRNRRKQSITNVKNNDDDFFSGFNRNKKVSLARRETESDPFGYHEKAPLKPANRILSGRSSASSAKQIYVSKSRYLPGINSKNSATKESAPSSNWSSTQGLSPLNRPSNNIGGKHYAANAPNPGYVPSFGSNKSNYNPNSWRSQAPPISLNNHSGTLRGKPIGAAAQVTGRTDWAAKYLTKS